MQGLINSHNAFVASANAQIAAANQRNGDYSAKLQALTAQAGTLNNKIAAEGTVIAAVKAGYQADNSRIAILIDDTKVRLETHDREFETKYGQLKKKGEDLERSNTDQKRRLQELSRHLHWLAENRSTLSIDPPSRAPSVLEREEDDFNNLEADSLLASLNQKFEEALNLQSKLEMEIAQSPTSQSSVSESILPGIPNIGNSCYINATLQALFSSPAFLELLNQNNQDAIFLKLIRLFNSLKSDSLSQAAFDFRQSVFDSGINRDLSTGLSAQKDAMQLMRVVLERAGYPGISLMGKKWANAAAFDDADDENKFTTTDSHFDLQMPIPQSGGLLQHVVANYFTAQQVNDNFRGYSSFTSQYSFAGNPGNLLVLSLHRFDNTLGKIFTPITLPADGRLSIASYQYRIVGCIHHIGNTLSSGHYITYRLHEGRWYECDDNNTSEVDYHSVICDHPRGESYAFVLEKV